MIANMVRVSQHKIKAYLNRPDGELDLHGYTKAEAEREVSDFLATAERLGWRKVKIITGRGLNSPDGRGVLKEFIGNYLVARGYRYEAARGTDGGPGSLIVAIP